MKVFLSLSSLLLQSFFGLSRLRLEKTPGGIAKQVGIGLLVLYGVGSIVTVFVLSTLASYDALAPAGLQDMVILNNLVLASILSSGLGLILLMSIYFMSGAELSLQALPLRPWQVFSAKFVLVYAAQLVLALLVLLPTLAIFGIREQPGFLFYFFGVIGLFLVPLLPVCLVFFLVVPIMRVFRRARNRSALLFVGGFLGLVALVAFQVYFQSGLAQSGNPEWVMATMGKPDSLIASVASLYPPSFLLWNAMTGGASGVVAGAAAGAEAAATAAFFPAFGSFLLLLGLCALALLGTIAALSKAYTESLVGFDERRLRKTLDSEFYIQGQFTRGGLKFALFRREWVLMNRELSYFLNGPFVILLVPLIFLVLFLVQGSLFDEQLDIAFVLDQLRQVSGQAFLLLIPAALGAFLGGSTMITCTSFSRDAKFLPFLKSLPIRPADLGMAKLLHGLAFGGIAICITSLPLAIFLQLRLVDSILSLGIAVSLVWLSSILGLYLDTARPRLRWDSTLAAFKQNPNAIIGLLGNMGLLVLVAAAAIGLQLDRFGYFALIFLPTSLGSRALTLRYPAFLEARLPKFDS